MCAQWCLTLCDPTGYSLTDLSVAFSRQKYWSELPFPTLLTWGFKPISWGFCIGRWILYHWATWEAPNQ